MVQLFSIQRHAVTAAVLVTLTAGSAFAAPVATTPAQITIVGSDLAAAQFPSPALVTPMTRAVGGAPIQRASPLSVAPEVIPGPPTPGFYPADMANLEGNPTLQNFTVHNVIVNPVVISPNVYGQSFSGPTLADADTFMTNLFASSFIQLADQYTGPLLSRTVGQAGVITFNSFKTTYNDPEVTMFVHAAARTFGAGPGQMINIFFKQGTDTCTTFGGSLLDTACYSPDVPSKFAFCGYHSYIDFIDLGRVYYSIEPYDNVPGCQAPGPNTPSRAVNSMASVLSHETFETMTDPNLDAFYIRFGAFAGNEIGDICAFRYRNVTLNGKTYSLQPEYSNAFHACAVGPAPVN